MALQDAHVVIAERCIAAQSAVEALGAKLARVGQLIETVAPRLERAAVRRRAARRPV